MKALFINPGGTAYGSGRSMLNLLRARQFEAEVVCPGGGALASELAELGITHHHLEFGKYSLRRNPLWHLRFFLKFRKLLCAARPDGVVINLDGNTPWITIAAVMADIPILRFSRFEFTPPTSRVDRWCWLQAKAILCPSDWVRNQVLAWAPSRLHERIHRLYEVCEIRDVAAWEIRSFRENFGVQDSKLIGYIGRFHRAKRIETAIEALALVCRKFPNARLMIVGGYEGSDDERSYKAELEALAKHLGLAHAVIFTGYMDHARMPVAAAAFDVSVLPSESESFGLALVESWAQAVPTVASDVSGCREITLASGGGKLCPVGDAPAFAASVLEFLREPGLAEYLGFQGKNWVGQACLPREYAGTFLRIASSVCLS